MTMDIIIATRNKDKQREIRAILRHSGLSIRTIDEFRDAPEVEENADTFEGNAALKARSAFDHTGIPSIADDSGLSVDALSGEPGIHSARYSGEGATHADNNALLLS